MGFRARRTRGVIRACGPCEVRRKSPLAMLRSHAFYGFTACYYNFWAKGLHETIRLPTGSVRCTCQHRTKLCGYCTGLGIPVRSVVLDHTGPYGARNGSIAPNSPAGPVADRHRGQWLNIARANISNTGFQRLGSLAWPLCDYVFQCGTRMWLVQYN